MSYDIWATHGPYSDWDVAVDLGNYTSNVSGMWRAACPKLDGLAGIHGKLGFQISHDLKVGLVTMFRERDELREMNPDNGWGDFEGAFRYFAGVVTAARLRPELTFWVDR